MVQIHAGAALAALAVGAFVLAIPKGTASHRALGWLWVILMAGAALTSFAIASRPGQFSLLHIFSAWTLIALVLGLRHRYRGERRDHAWTMGLTFLGLVAAAVLALEPGRLMHRILLGS